MFALILFYHSFSTKVYLDERFSDGWEKRWKKPSHVRKGVQLGRFRVNSGFFWGDEKKQRGLETMDGKRNYLFYRNLTHRVDNRFSDLIIQYTLRLNYYVDCSGQYIKLLSSDVDPTRFSNETDYLIMFGPDVCGATLRKTHVIIGHKGKHYETKKQVNCIKDHLTHAYTLVIRKNNTIEVWIDGNVVDKGNLFDRFNVPAGKKRPDENEVKPEDWDDDEWIVDPNDKKTDNWVDDEFIPDPDAIKPLSWDDSIIWAPPMIRNPNYKGEWTPKIIKNPKYKGIWKQKMIEEDVEKDPTFGHFKSIGFIGLEFFQNVPNTIFNNFLITDNETYAREVLDDVFLSIRVKEVKNFDEQNKRLKRERELEDLRSRKNDERVENPNLISDSDDDDDYFKRLRSSNKRNKKRNQQFDDL